jgi:hypothetical protein
VVGAHQVVGVPLSGQVGAVARDPGRWGPLDRPLDSKGKLDDDWVIELQQVRVVVHIDQDGASMPQPRSGSATGRGRRRREITLSA